MESTIKIYPVGNGDHSVISVYEDNYTTNIMVDCDIRKSSEGDEDPAKFDVKADLLRCLPRRSDMLYVDVLILTHGDYDHCRGFEEHFYQGDPRKYSNADKKNDRIFIDVLWFSPMALQECGNDDAEAFKKEARRRIKLHNDASPDKDLPGNRIVIIGYNGNEELSDLNTVRKVPGNVVTKFNERQLSTFSIFIHAPYKKQLARVDDLNHTSIVFQARFKEKKESTDFCVLAMFGGDADYIAWDIIMSSSIDHKNEDALNWDLLLAPHHCSWTFFNESGEKEPTDSSLVVLDYKRKGGIIISSSKPILNDDKNPPSYKAKQEYLKKLDKSSQFLNTAIEPYQVYPEPIVFIVTPNGPARVPKSTLSSTLAAAGGAGAPSIKTKQG